MNQGERLFEYVPIPDAMDFVLAGWLPSPALAGTNHGEWSILMEWKCQCRKPAYPPASALARRRALRAAAMP